jgi:hypothetical protein
MREGISTLVVYWGICQGNLVSWESGLADPVLVSALVQFGVKKRKGPSLQMSLCIILGPQ